MSREERVQIPSSVLARYKLGVSIMAKPQSLAAQAGALSEGFKLPAIFQAPQQAVKARYIAPYVTFAHPKRADEWNKIAAKYGQPEEGSMFLVESEQITALATAKLGWLCHKQYWALANPAGEVQQVSLEERAHPYKEHIEAVVIVYFEDTIVPANVCFRTTKCPAAKALADTLIESSDGPTWAAKSNAHKETLILQQPFCRFFGLVTMGAQRTSKSSGLPYRPTQCTIHPTSISEWRLLQKLNEGSDGKVFEDAAARFESRIKEMGLKVK